MIETIKELFVASPTMAWSIVSVLAAMVVMASMWEKVKWWWLNTWMSFPLIGTVANLSRDISIDGEHSSWYKSELSLCEKYENHIKVRDEADFNNLSKYITKAGDTGRDPMPKWLWILTALLVFAEAMGFSYVLAGWTIPGASENLQQTGALGIAFVISIILVAFTHWAGHECYVSSKIKQARSKVSDGDKLNLKEVSLNEPQTNDDGEPSYIQLMSRVGSIASYKITYLTLGFVVAVGLGALYVRGQVLEKALQLEVTGSSNTEINVKLNTDGLDMSAKGGDSSLPDADLSANNAAKEKAVLDAVDIDRHGGWGTFIVLSFIFMFLQLLGALFGYKWGFAGKNSSDAYHKINGSKYSTFADVLNHVKYVSNCAQEKLGKLQQKLNTKNQQEGSARFQSSNTFKNYREMLADEASKARIEDHRRKANEAKQIENIKAPTNNHIQLNEAINKSSADLVLTLDKAVEHVDSLDDKSAKKDYIGTLPSQLQKDLLSHLQQRKQNQQVKIDSQFDDVL